MLTIRLKVSCHVKMTKNISLLLLFELMTALGAKPMIILRNVSIFYTNLGAFQAHFRCNNYI